MPQKVEVKRDPRLPLDSLGHPTQHAYRVPVRDIEDAVARQPLEQCLGAGIEGDRPRFPALPSDDDHAVDDVGPAQPENLAPPQARVEDERTDRVERARRRARDQSSQ